MIYLIGGAPRTGKSTLAQHLSAQQGIGWISTDVLLDLLRFKQVDGIKNKWDATPHAIRADAEWFYPCLERFIWAVNSVAQSYIIEGVDFLPEHVVRLSKHHAIRAVFLGCAQMTLDLFDRFPGHSRGYASLPEAVRSQFAQDIPPWSEFIRQEAARCGCTYIDTSGDFRANLKEAQTLLTTGPLPSERPIV